MLLVRNKKDKRKAYRLDVKGKKGKDAKKKKNENNEGERNLKPRNNKRWRRWKRKTGFNRFDLGVKSLNWNHTHFITITMRVRRQKHEV